LRCEQRMRSFGQVVVVLDDFEHEADLLEIHKLEAITLCLLW
jgi:hypothetical protein